MAEVFDLIYLDELRENEARYIRLRGGDGGPARDPGPADRDRGRRLPPDSPAPQAAQDRLQRGQPPRRRHLPPRAPGRVAGLWKQVPRQAPRGGELGAVLRVARGGDGDRPPVLPSLSRPLAGRALPGRASLRADLHDPVPADQEPALPGD